MDEKVKSAFTEAVGEQLKKYRTDEKIKMMKDDVHVKDIGNELRFHATAVSSGNTAVINYVQVEDARALENVRIDNLLPVETSMIEKAKLKI